MRTGRTVVETSGALILLATYHIPLTLVGHYTSEMRQAARYEALTKEGEVRGKPDLLLLPCSQKERGRDLQLLATLRACGPYGREVWAPCNAAVRTVTLRI